MFGVPCAYVSLSSRAEQLIQVGLQKVHDVSAALTSFLERSRTFDEILEGLSL